jgi:hypothetical protein
MLRCREVIERNRDLAIESECAHETDVAYRGWYWDRIARSDISLGGAIAVA